MVKYIEEENALLELGEISTERGVVAKRNLFIFCSIILLIDYTNYINVNHVQIFGLSPFRDGDVTAWVFISIVVTYLIFNWIFQYYQGWLIWRSKFESATQGTPLRVFFGISWYDENSWTQHISAKLEKEEGVYGIALTNKDGTTQQGSKFFSEAAIIYVRNQVGIYYLGVLILFIVSNLTIFSIYNQVVLSLNSTQ